jgi:lauroyl/myristoyl acyltransferase
MIFGESRAKDVYRRVVWGPAADALEAIPAPWEAAIVRVGGRVAAEAMRARRGRIRRNMVRAFGERPEIDRWSAEAFAAHASNQYAPLSFAKCTTATWPRYLAFEGLEHLQRGRGIVVIHPHMGPAQLPLHVLGLLGFAVHQIAGGRVPGLSATGRWAAWQRAERERSLAAFLHDGARYLRPVVRALRAGEVVFTACDATGGGVELGRRELSTVLGQRMPIPIGGVKLARMTGAEILTLTCGRRRESSPLFEARLAPFEGDVAAFLTRALTEHPGDWHFWDRFEPGGLL